MSMVVDTLRNISMDKILIKDLFLRCTIGVSAEERREKVDVVINITLLIDLHKVGRSDLMDDTVNYRDLKKRIIAMVEHSQYSLIEALAERIASLSLEAPMVLEAQVLVEKPGALRFARSVGVEIIRRKEEVNPVKVYIGIGSNIDPKKNILKSIELLEKHVSILSSSLFYKTNPIGNPNDPSFINGVIEIETTLSPESLKYSILRSTEATLGRKRSSDKNAPRTIDLDILIYGNEVVKLDDLTIPDPQISERNFLAVSLAELAPTLRPPGWNQNLLDYASRLEDLDMRPLEGFSEIVKQQINKQMGLFVEA